MEILATIFVFSFYRLALATFASTLLCLHPATYDHLMMPFLGVVIAVYANGPTIGASCRMSIHAVRGICYCSFAASMCALLFGHSRLAVGVTLFLTCILFMLSMGPSLPPLQRKLFLGYNAYLFLVHVRNPALPWYYSFKILYSALIGAGTAIAASMLPFPLTASSAMEARAHRVMLHSARLFYVLSKAMFSITGEQYDTSTHAQLAAQQQQQRDDEEDGALGSPTEGDGSSMCTASSIRDSASPPPAYLHPHTHPHSHPYSHHSPYPYTVYTPSPSSSQHTIFLPPTMQRDRTPNRDQSHISPAFPFSSLVSPEIHSSFAQAMRWSPHTHARTATLSHPHSHVHVEMRGGDHQGRYSDNYDHTHLAPPPSHGYVQAHGYGYAHSPGDIYDAVTAHAYTHAHAHDTQAHAHVKFRTHANDHVDVHAYARAATYAHDQPHPTLPHTHILMQQLHHMANDLASPAAIPLGKGSNASLAQYVYSQPSVLSSAITNTTTLTSPFAQLLLMEAQGLVSKVEEEVVAAMAMIDDLNYESWLYRVIYNLLCCRCRAPEVAEDEYGNPQPDATYPLFGSWRGAYGAPYSAKSAQTMLSHLSALAGNARGMASGVEALTKLDYNGTLLLQICSLYLKPYAEEVCAQVRAFVLMLVDKNADMRAIDGPFLREMLRDTKGHRETKKHAAPSNVSGSVAGTAPSSSGSTKSSKARMSPLRVANTAYVFEDLFAVFGPKQPHPALYRTIHTNTDAHVSVSGDASDSPPLPLHGQAGSQDTLAHSVNAPVQSHGSDSRASNVVSAGSVERKGDADLHHVFIPMNNNSSSFYAPSHSHSSTHHLLHAATQSSSPPTPKLTHTTSSAPHLAPTPSHTPATPHLPSGSYAAALHALYAMWFAYSSIRKRIFDNARIEHAKARVYAEIARFRAGEPFDALVLARYVLDDGHRGTVLSSTGALRSEILLRNVAVAENQNASGKLHFSRDFSGEGIPGLVSSALVRTVHGTLLHLDRFNSRFATLVVHGEYYCPATDALMFPAAVRAALAPHVQPSYAHAHHPAEVKIPVPPHFRIQDLLSLNYTFFNADRFLTRLLHKVAPQVYVHLTPLTALSTTMPLALAYPNDQFAGYDIFAQTRVVDEDEGREASDASITAGVDSHIGKEDNTGAPAHDSVCVGVEVGSVVCADAVLAARAVKKVEEGGAPHANTPSPPPPSPPTHTHTPHSHTHAHTSQSPTAPSDPLANSPAHATDLPPCAVDSSRNIATASPNNTPNTPSAPDTTTTNIPPAATNATPASITIEDASVGLVSALRPLHVISDNLETISPPLSPPGPPAAFAKAALEYDTDARDPVLSYVAVIPSPASSDEAPPSFPPSPTSPSCTSTSSSQSSAHSTPSLILSIPTKNVSSPPSVNGTPMPTLTDTPLTPPSPTPIATLTLRIDTIHAAHTQGIHAPQHDKSAQALPLPLHTSLEQHRTLQPQRGPLLGTLADTDAANTRNALYTSSSHSSSAPSSSASSMAPSAVTSASQTAIPPHPGDHLHAASARYIPLPPPSFPPLAPTPAYYFPPPLFPPSFFADILMPHALSVALTFLCMVFCPASPARVDNTSSEAYGAPPATTDRDRDHCHCNVPEWVPVFSRMDATTSPTLPAQPGAAYTDSDPMTAAGRNRGYQMEESRGGGEGCCAYTGAGTHGEAEAVEVGPVVDILPEITEVDEEEGGDTDNQGIGALPTFPVPTGSGDADATTNSNTSNDIANTTSIVAAATAGTTETGISSRVCLYCANCGGIAPTRVQMSLLGRQYTHYEQSMAADDSSAAYPVRADKVAIISRIDATNTASDRARDHSTRQTTADSADVQEKHDLPPLSSRFHTAVQWLLPLTSADHMRFRHSLKICIAISIASLLALIPGPVYFVNPYWAPLTIGFVFSDTVGSGFLTSLGRLQGTLLGSVFGYVTGMISQQVDPSYGIAYAYTCSCLLTVWALACAYVRTGTTHVYAASVAVFTAVAIAIGIGKDFGRYALARVEMTMCGIVITVAVMTLMWPERAGKDDLKRIANVLKESVLCLELNFHLLHMSSVDEVEDTLRSENTRTATVEMMPRDKHMSDKLSYRLYGPSLLPGVNVDVVAKGRVTLGAALENIKTRFARTQAREQYKQAVLHQLRDVHTRYSYNGVVRVAGDAASGSTCGHTDGAVADGSASSAPMVCGGLGGGDVTLPMDSEEFKHLLAANRARDMPSSPVPLLTPPEALPMLQQDPFGAASVIRLFFSSLFPNIPLPESPAQFMVIYNRTIEHKLINMRTQVVVQRRLALEAQAEPILCGRTEAPTALLFDVIEHQVKLIRTLSRMQECLFLHQWCLQRMEGKHALADELLAWKRTEDERRLQMGLAVRDKAWGRDLLRDIGVDAYQVTRQHATDVSTRVATSKALPQLMAKQRHATEGIDYHALDPEHYSNTFVEHSNTPAPSILDMVSYRDTLASHAGESRLSGPAPPHSCTSPLPHPHVGAHTYPRAHSHLRGYAVSGEEPARYSTTVEARRSARSLSSIASVCTGMGMNTDAGLGAGVSGCPVDDASLSCHTQTSNRTPIQAAAAPLPSPPPPPGCAADDIGSSVGHSTSRGLTQDIAFTLDTHNSTRPTTSPSLHSSPQTMRATATPSPLTRDSRARLAEIVGGVAPVSQPKRVARYPTIYNFAELAASACRVLSALVDDINGQVESASGDAFPCVAGKGRFAEMCCCDDLPEDVHCSCSDEGSDEECASATETDSDADGGDGLELMRFATVAAVATAPVDRDEAVQTTPDAYSAADASSGTSKVSHASAINNDKVVPMAKTLNVPQHTSSHVNTPPTNTLHTHIRDGISRSPFASPRARAFSKELSDGNRQHSHDSYCTCYIPTADHGSPCRADCLQHSHTKDAGTSTGTGMVDLAHTHAPRSTAAHAGGTRNKHGDSKGGVGSATYGTGSSILSVLGLGDTQEEEEEVAALVRDDDYASYDVAAEVDAATYRRTLRKRRDREKVHEEDEPPHSVDHEYSPLSDPHIDAYPISRHDDSTSPRHHQHHDLDHHHHHHDPHHHHGPHHRLHQRHQRHVDSVHSARGEGQSMPSMQSPIAPTTTKPRHTFSRVPAMTVDPGTGRGISMGAALEANTRQFRAPAPPREKKHRAHCPHSPLLLDDASGSQLGALREWARERVRVRHLYAILLRLMSGYEHACSHRVVARASGDHALMYPSLFLLTEHAFMESTMQLSNVLMQLTLTIRALHLATSVWRK